eukprot:2985704-Pyramimonas_sp.AAC.2
MTEVKQRASRRPQIKVGVTTTADGVCASIGSYTGCTLQVGCRHPSRSRHRARCDWMVDQDWILHFRWMLMLHPPLVGVLELRGHPGIVVCPVVEDEEGAAGVELTADRAPALDGEPAEVPVGR